MKKVVAFLVVLCLAGVLFAQDGRSLTETDPAMTADAARQALREVSLDLFEREGSWNCRISPDVGIITGRLFEGGPYTNMSAEDRAAKLDLPAEVKDSDNSHVYGIKAEFFRRGVNSFYITASRPIPIEGVTKTVSFWAAGRNQDHKITMLVQDYFGNSFEVYVGSLAFSGWKRMSVAIPPSPDGSRGIVQQSSYFGERPGLRIVGFRIDCDPETAIGSYYLYLDDLRAVTDLYAMENRDADDPSDAW